MIITSDLGTVRTHRRHHTEPAPAPLPAGLPYRAQHFAQANRHRPVPVQPAETVISATLQHATGQRAAVLLTSRRIYLDTRAQVIEIDHGSGSQPYALAAGRIVLARRDALTLATWRRTLAGEE